MKLWLYIELALIAMALVLVLEGYTHPACLAVGWGSALWRAFIWKRLARSYAEDRRLRPMSFEEIRYNVDGVIKRDVQ